MLVKNTKEYPAGDWEPLKRGGVYFVYALVCDDVGGAHYLLLNPHTKSPYMVIYQAKDFEVIDQELPSEWKVTYFSDSQAISVPSLVMSFPELLDIDRFIRVHDLNETEQDRAIILKYKKKYEKMN